MSEYSKRGDRVAVACASFAVLVVAVLVRTGDAQPSAAPQLTPQQKQALAVVKQAQAHVAKSEWDPAIQAAGKAIQIDPQSAGARVARGMAFNGKRDYDNAIKDFDWVAEQTGRDPDTVANRADAYANRSFSYYQKGEHLEAINSAYFATLEKGDHFHAHNFRAMAYIAREQFDKAINSTKFCFIRLI